MDLFLIPRSITLKRKDQETASRFHRAAAIRAERPLEHEVIRAVVPSIFADAKHNSRSDRYTYIPTIDVLNGLRKEGFQPFMVCQTRCRDETKRDDTKHMIRLRHADQIAAKDANEIILLNSHDGTSSYQILAGVFRFVCQNGMVRGETKSDIRVRHNGDIIDNVIEGAFTVLDDFEALNNEREAMESVTVQPDEQAAFARAALMLRYDVEEKPAPITETQLLRPRRMEDRGDDSPSTVCKKIY